MRKPVKISLAVVGLVCVLAAAIVAGLLLWRPSLVSGPECTVPGSSSADPGASAAEPTVDLTVVQLQHASTINAVGLSRGIPERGRIIAVATAYQESSLRNRTSGDRDSVGLFQQRPSQGWGTADQISDPIYASGKFYDALLQVQGWQKMPLTQAAQAVQQSAHPDAYAKWEPQATTLVRSLSGTAPLRLSCEAGARQPTSMSPDRPPLAGTDDATAELSAVLGSAEAELGGLTVDSISTDGRTGTITAAVATLDPEAAGRALAAWAVAHSTGMNIQEVDVGDQRWVDHSWQAGQPAPQPGQVAITVSP